MEICRVGIVFRSRGDKNCNILFISKYNKEMQLALGTSLFFLLTCHLKRLRRLSRDTIFSNDVASI